MKNANHKPNSNAEKRIAHAKAAKAWQDYYANRPGKTPKPQRFNRAYLNRAQ